MKNLNFGPLFKSRNLSKGQKYCVAVTALYALGRRDQATQLIRKAMSDERIPLRLFSELFIHLSLFLGFPTMLEGLERLNVLNGAVKKPARQGRKISTADGLKVFRKIYGDSTEKVLSGLNALHEHMTRWVLRDAYGKIFVRPGISLAERELVNVVVLGMQGFAPQFYSHVRGALRVGVPVNGVIDTVLFIDPVSKIEKRVALRLLSQITKSHRVRLRIY
ncbi:MAG: hypothetical protein HY562_09205 [Ignavibacteriales bacterium]|nr:hypothetical protein [Ignavibacteriales bacterium]